MRDISCSESESETETYVPVKKMVFDSKMSDKSDNETKTKVKKSKKVIKKKKMSSVDSNKESDTETVVPIKTIVEGEDFRKLQRKAKKLGAKSLDYSKRKDMKYTVTLETGKKINFGSAKYEDYLSHKDEERREKYLKRAKTIKNKQGELTFDNPQSANYWSLNLLW